EHVAGLQPLQAGHHVGPGRAAVPRAIQLDGLGFAEPGHAILAKQRVEPLAVDAVHVRPRPLAFAHRVHAGAIAALPVVDERLPVRADALLLAEGPKLLDQAAPPVDDRAEDI